jgi:hypothetical protein
VYGRKKLAQGCFCKAMIRSSLDIWTVVSLWRCQKGEERHYTV